MPINADKIAVAGRKSGWTHFNGAVLTEDTIQVGSQAIEPFWQLRIAVKPTHENIQKAMRALSKVEQLNQNNQHPSFKIFNIPATTGTPEGWDGCVTGADRDQRGKEICIYMSHKVGETSPDYYDKATGYPSQAYMKELMLSIWKAMQDEGVEIAYTTPGVGEKEISCTDDSITPFSYSSFKPYKGIRHGILHSTEYNPLKFADPLQNLSISVDDLKKAKISRLGEGTSLKRLEYQIDHYQQFKKTIEEEMDQILQSPPVSRTEKEKSLEDKNKGLLKQEFSKLRPDLNTDQLNLMIDNDFKKMEAIYRKLVHLNHENEAIFTEAQRCQKLLGTNLAVEPHAAVIKILANFEFMTRFEPNATRRKDAIVGIIMDYKNGRLDLNNVLEKLIQVNKTYPGSNSLLRKIAKIQKISDSEKMVALLEEHTKIASEAMQLMSPNSDVTHRFKDRVPHAPLQPESPQTPAVVQDKGIELN